MSNRDVFLKAIEIAKLSKDDSLFFLEKNGLSPTAGVILLNAVCRMNEKDVIIYMRELGVWKNYTENLTNQFFDALEYSTIITDDTSFEAFGDMKGLF